MSISKSPEDNELSDDSKSETQYLSADQLVKGKKDALKSQILLELALENGVLETLLIIEKLFRAYYDLYCRETLAQREIANKLGNLSERYIIATRVDVCRTTNVFTIVPEEKLIVDFNNLYQAFLISIRKLMCSIDGLRRDFLNFNKAYDHIVKSGLETPFVLGDAQHKPIAFFYELINDIFQYFHCGLLKLDYHAKLLDPADLDTVNALKALLVPSEEFEEYLMVGLTYCKCFEARPRCSPAVAPQQPKKCTLGVELPVKVPKPKHNEPLILLNSAFVPASAAMAFSEEAVAKNMRARNTDA